MMSTIPVVILMTAFAVSVQCECPSICQCKWKWGKQTVECKGQGLEKVPEDLESDTQVLDLSDNHLVTLPAIAFSLVGLLNLQRLYIRSSRLAVIHVDAFAQLSNLVELDLSDNFLTSVPSAAFKGTPSLRDVNLAGNQITRVRAEAFHHIPNLLKLDLSGCHLEDIQARAFSKLISLETLKINSNQLTVLSNETVESLGALHVLELHDNPWNCNCELVALMIWIGKNISHPISPVCHSPAKVSGKIFSQLAVADFACVPRILDNSRHISVDEGENATFDCIFESTPRASARWYLYGRPIANNTLLSRHRKFLIYQEWWKSSLVLTNVRRKDDGEFFCVVENSAGFTEANFTLSVRLPSRQSPELLAIATSLSIILVILALLLPTLLCFRQRNLEAAKPASSTLASVVMPELSKADSCDNPDLILETSSKEDTMWPKYPQDYGLPLILPQTLIQKPPLSSTRTLKTGARITASSTPGRTSSSPDEGYQEEYVGTDV